MPQIRSSIMIWMWRGWGWNIHHLSIYLSSNLLAVQKSVNIETLNRYLHIKDKYYCLTFKHITQQFLHWCSSNCFFKIYFLDNTGCFFFFGFTQGAVKQLFWGVLSSIFYFLHSKIWAHFHFGTFEQQE